jgi:hypothetical protein
MNPDPSDADVLYINVKPQGKDGEERLNKLCSML